MTADGDDHILPDKLNYFSKSSESQYSPSLLGSHVVLQPCTPLNLVFMCVWWGVGGLGGVEQSQNKSSGNA